MNRVQQASSALPSLSSELRSAELRLPRLEISKMSSPETGLARHDFSIVGLVADLFNLTKPKIIVLLLISTVCPMVLAAGGHVSLSLMFWTSLGGALVSASASVLNCIWDADIDRLMERTKTRPLAAKRLSTTTAFVFSLLLGGLGLTVLNFYVNPLAAQISLLGHLFYVFIYTIWLKRITPQNIVIGGAAGAIPPLVGWVAVRGSLDLDAILLFLLVFLWTPPHFWALALNKNADYQRAGVPMLPVVLGERATLLRMFWYAVSLLPISFFLVYSNPDLGLLSYLVLLGLGALFVYKVTRLLLNIKSTTENKERLAWDVFGFSLIYLALFFVCLVVDSLI